MLFIIHYHILNQNKVFIIFNLLVILCLSCSDCKLTCHKKCYTKVTSECGKDVIISGSSPHHVFGVPLNQLATGDGKVPLVMDRLITTVEMYGLYMEGIYRKSGVCIIMLSLIRTVIN